jgi:hypothetical protein
MHSRLVLRISYTAVSGWDYSVFATVSPTQKTYLAARGGGGGGARGCTMTERGEDTFTMITVVAVYAAFCGAALLWLA